MIWKKKMSKTLIYALGGLEEVGKNTYCIEHNNEIIIIDAGLKFPNKYFLNINFIIPDYQYLVKNKHKIKGLFVTHGHEDHIGGIPFLIKATGLKTIYSPAFANDLIKLKTKKQTVQIISFKHDSVFRFRHFEISFFAITHSIPHSFGVVVKTPNGRIVSTGDFKLDWTPLGKKTEIHKISELGQKGVALLLSDSTNSEIPGHTLTERTIMQNIMLIFDKNVDKRIFITTFASNMNRIIHLIHMAEKCKRKILILGRTIENAINIFREKKYFKIDFKNFIKVDDLHKFRPEEILIICTGSQGEPNSVISKLANQEYPKITIGKNDLFIFSSKPIPGNNYIINNVINKLFKLNADVQVDSVSTKVHTSGHASQEEQKIILVLLKPTYFLPVHGEYRMLKTHKETAIKLGMKAENVFVIPNGQQLELVKGKIKLGAKIPADPLFIGNNKDNNDDLATLNERQILLTNGIVNVICFYDSIYKQFRKAPSYQVFGVNGFETDQKFLKILNEEIMMIGKRADFKQMTDKTREKTLEFALSQQFYKLKKSNPIIKVFIHE